MLTPNLNITNMTVQRDIEHKDLNELIKPIKELKLDVLTKSANRLLYEKLTNKLVLIRTSAKLSVITHIL